MSGLKLGRLPDRKPVRISITVSPELAQGLREYAAVYRATYGEAESVANLIPFMLSAFLDSDRGFARARKSVPLDPVEDPARRRRGRRLAPDLPSTPTTED